MKVMNIVQALNDALDLKLADDKNIVMYGEDVGVEGGVFRVEAVADGGVESTITAFIRCEFGRRIRSPLSVVIVVV